MYITRVELENIKSHASSVFDFPRGTTAISGENGAGKTTLIESIAWTLFDVLDYKKEDFVRRGTRRGVARVTFESGLDGRLYTVYRDTGTGYNVYDPHLKMRVAEKKEEVSRFLWLHLGLEPGTDLESLYRRAIGVPQGTFTAIFLETAAERKKAFDKLLKVEEYRRSAEELLKTARFIDQQSVVVREKIARFEGEIARSDTVQQEYGIVVEQGRDLGSKLDTVTTSAAEQQAELQRLDRLESELNRAKTEFDKCQSEERELAFVVKQRDHELDQAHEAAARIEEVKADFERHSNAILRLNDLEREREQREKLRVEFSKTENAMAAVHAEEKYVKEMLASALKAHATITELKPAVIEQGRLESELVKLRDSAAEAKAIGAQIKALNERIERLRNEYRANTAKLSDATNRTKSAGGLPDLEKRDGEIIRELASLHAALERDERFQKEIKDGLCPILSQKCLNLKEGETLDDFVTSQFTELRTRIAVLETEHGNVGVALRSSREAESFLTQLSMLQTRGEEIKAEGKALTDEKARLQTHLDASPQIEADLAKTEARLKVLDNPKGRTQLLEDEAHREGELRRKLSDVESNLERLESDKRILVEQLELYKDFDARWAEFTGIRDSTTDANRIYLANDALAKSVDQRSADLESAKKELASCEQSMTAAREIFDSASRNYDAGGHAATRASFLDLQKRQVELTATLSATKQREAELSVEIARLTELKQSIRTEFAERERLERVSELTTFIRETLKEAAPLVARNYVFHVSAEANLMFREITGNAEHTLKWSEDYSILLEEGGHERPFQSLSGGEQMAAALAVRLALLKQLTDLRIAFFDEPTTNLDIERRENLAMQISQIKHFDQLFVISHDDTFEGYVDNVITIERGENEDVARGLGMEA
ncbi:MAG TPA: SMC family ATPase [Pyrinomonadaceae bacterium]|nr:SMC family ATPase [Pyrinomonadaceae bacterium]